MKHINVENCINSLINGSGIVVLDDFDRENEGDIIFPAQTITNQQMTLLIRECSGIVCVAISDRIASKLELNQMVANNSCPHTTAFTVSVDASQNVSTGVSAADRLETVRIIGSPTSLPNDLTRPGHVFPLRAHPKGLQARRGHTEAAVCMMKLAGFDEAAVLSEIMNIDGSMARKNQTIAAARRLGLPAVTVTEIKRFENSMQPDEEPK